MAGELNHPNSNNKENFMLNTTRAFGGMAVAPHTLAAQAGRDVLREGGNALEAAIAMAASLAVHYPHMTGLGGDSFWLLAAPGGEVRAIDACGRTPETLSPDFYRQRGHRTIPVRGPLAANTVAGTVSGWDAAYTLSREQWGGSLPLERLLADAIHHARAGIPVTASQARNTTRFRAELEPQPGFAETYLPGGASPAAADLLRQPRLAATLERLAEAGLDDFYRGELAAAIAADLEAVDSPVGAADLAAHRAELAAPLELPGRLGTLYNMPPPTQGVASLAILGLYERKHTDSLVPESADYIHALVESTKQAFRLRDRYVRDPRDMTTPAEELIDPIHLDRVANLVDMHRALPWEGAGDTGDTTWFGAIDAEGRAVSVIQSLYHEYGSGVVLPATGLCWQNRGASFHLERHHPRELRPGRKPFHTLNPALARFDDGRVMVYGTMGGDGQPQTQAAVYTRYAHFGQELQAAITAPRWLLGRTWGSNSNTLKLEGRFPAAVVEELARRGHPVEVVGGFDEMMGHAGALVRHPGGLIEGAADPRSDGCVAAF